MSYDIYFSAEAKEGIKKHKKSGNKSALNKLYSLLEELTIHPKIGTGKPEQLRGYNGDRWSRRIDSKHRLVYDINDSELSIISVSTYGHYGDK